jgi:hypothetical protein
MQTKKSSDFWGFIVKNIISIATVIGGLFVLVLSMVGTLTDSKIILQVLLALLILLATSELVEGRKRLDTLLETQKELLGLAERKLCEVKVFDNVEEHYTFLEGRIRLGKSYIDIINFRPHLPRPSSGRQNYTKLLEEIMDKDSIRVRRVIIPYNFGTISWIKDLLNRFNGKNFWIAYYEKPPKYIPLLNILIIDEGEAFVGGFFRKDHPDDRGTIWLCDPELISTLKKYYDYLWDQSIKLNPNEIIKDQILKELEETTPTEFDV